MQTIFTLNGVLDGRKVAELAQCGDGRNAAATCLQALATTHKSRIEVRDMTSQEDTLP